MTLFLLIASEQKVYVPYISYLKYYHIKTSEYVLMTLINVPLPAMFISCLFNWSSLKKRIYGQMHRCWSECRFHFNHFLLRTCGFRCNLIFYLTWRHVLGSICDIIKTSTDMVALFSCAHWKTLPSTLSTIRAWRTGMIAKLTKIPYGAFWNNNDCMKYLIWFDNENKYIILKVRVRSFIFFHQLY